MTRIPAFAGMTLRGEREVQPPRQEHGMASTSPDTASDTRAPLPLRRAGWAALSLVLAGAGYLIVVRGEALIVDLSTLAGKVWCF